MENKENNIFQENKTRIIGLDLFRISLACLIFMFHSLIHFECNYGLFNAYLRTGATAMTGFMLLSGYAMSMVYSNTSMMNFSTIKKFYIKRLITIIPLYYAVAIMFTLFILAKDSTKIIDNAILLPIEALGLQTVFTTLFSFSHNGGTWFISCILFCYFIYPLFQTILHSMSNRSLVCTLITLSFIILWSPIVQSYFRLASIYSNPFFRVCEFGIGCVLYYLYNNVLKHTRMIKYAKSNLACITLVFTHVVGVAIVHHLSIIPSDYMLYNWFMLPFFSFLIVILVSKEFSRFQVSTIISYLSRISFSFYLCQVLPLWDLCKIIIEVFDCDNNIMRIFLSLFICLLSAITLHEFIEKPSAKFLKNKFL